ncbi:DNA-processing protein DprA [Nocardioides lianchengensis]|uniref:DNA processing protein n=1 Tax=Nocardioides lianchengensis TaxID=1045774 RepID=A0A1G6NAY2_9ACTN|nr:DNA-processing protein DprA [Nocardioides lianchengensis]NYG10716.1 DNA processing protein [Nocardioides lianchengensis]SDC64958.1 DNA processing protein [Nocardioides lianchengensis]
MSAPEAERLARVGLSLLTEPGDPRVAAVVGEVGAQALYANVLQQRADRPSREIRDDAASRTGGKDPAGELADAARAGLRFVVPGDTEWPDQLDDLAHVPVLQQRGGPPLGLWVKGPLRLDALARSVAVVGSRSATTYGADAAAELAAVVARAGCPVVSGAAFGIDQAAHRGALGGGGQTVAVLACGADRIYPQAHRDLLEHLAREGAVVSETAPGGAPMRIRFLSRNRIIAALTSGTVLVEAAVRSGALNTANWASRLQRPLMGVPGPITSAPSQGVHQLLRAGAATLVTSGAEVLEVVAPMGEHVVEEPRGRERSRDRLSTKDQQVLDAVPVQRSVGTDSIARTAGLAMLTVASALDRLRAGGFVERVEDGWRLAALAHE